MTQITKALNEEAAMTEEPAKTEENPNKNLTGDGPLAGKEFLLFIQYSICWFNYGYQYSK